MSDARDLDKPVTPDTKFQTESRRRFLETALAATATVYLGGVESLLQAMPSAAKNNSALIGFKGIPASADDTIVVPEGYSARVLIAWGDPISDGPEFRQDASNSAAQQALQWGTHNDGVAYFPIAGSERGLLVQNHEYPDDVLLFPDGNANWTAEKTKKALASVGVSVIEIRRERSGRWSVVRPSKFARRITGETPIRVSGPAAGDPRLRTSVDPSGRLVAGTMSNCALGVTPWNTFLTCEENFNDYFRTPSPPAPGSVEARYQLTTVGANYLYHTTHKRFSIAAEPNEPNRFGWVVEIDPFKPASVPVKRTGLGRMFHECAKLQETRDGRIVVYTGDDEQFEYIYRYVSRLPWRKAFERGISPLDDGTLYAAKFHDNGAGEWLPLTPNNRALRGWSLADILINSRGAADAVGATKMDRPEWLDTLPAQLSVFVALTKNPLRGLPGQPPVDAANPRAKNVYGHIVRWSYERDWTDSKFKWEIFALGGTNGSAKEGKIVGDIYGSPDGLYVAPSGRLWIQTDVSRTTINSGDYRGYGNNQMLCADASTRETRRFMVGPNQSEITGAIVTPDERTMFVGIQHPGEALSRVNNPANPKRFSSWPDGPTGGRPRSACVVITKDDGGPIGS